MKAFDVYVTSSTQEAFGRVLLEAMVAQIPVIATRVNGMPEVLGTTGVLVNPKDPENLAAAMLKLYQASQGEREGVAARGYARALSAFSIPRFAEVLGNLLPGLDSNQ
jgi:glycosyltransferase involved in cell wall biosynthesis